MSHLMFDLTPVLKAPVLALAGLAIPFLVSLKIYPIIIYTVRTKNLMDEPGARSLHGNKVPTMGGVGLFISFSLTSILLALVTGLSQWELLKLLSVLAGSMILFFLGVKDDLIALAPSKKIVGQVLAAILVVFLADIRIESFFGLMGVGILPYWVSAIFTILIFLLLINAYNLIDGIDGLAGTITLITCATFMPFFFLNGDGLLLLVSSSLIGATTGFLFFNLSAKKRLFMGDTGSLFMGFLVAFLGVSFLAVNSTGNFAVSSGPALVLAVLSFPLLDTMRVSVIRIWNKKSLFKADRNHIHHRLLGLGLKHFQATFIIALMNLMLIATVLILNELNIQVQLIMVLGLAPIYYFLPFAIAYTMGSTPVKMPVDMPVIAEEVVVDEIGSRIKEEPTPISFLEKVDVPTEGMHEKTAITSSAERAKILEKAMDAFKKYKSTN
ncbi:MAG: undecaprenyl/decaprenyl-phosphate alpha-N-acetylglucosaminyl 1-phosphate transferase [Bacteroidia bacterium]|nr:undecaprenyl/decaprenyl-phosphate alpha-N-acetylglucosaminyl 1-phosphate transferase [Bacteroidia bacterium]